VSRWVSRQNRCSSVSTMGANFAVSNRLILTAIVFHINYII
jgi:hypothetical protein